MPATFDERRFFVLDVSADRVGDAAYFATLVAERRNGGPAALLRALLSEDLCGFDVRFAPRTAALADQIERGLPTVAAWWRDCLTRGYVTDRQRIFAKRGDGAEMVEHQGAEWHRVVRRDLFQESFADFWTKQRLGSHMPAPNIVAKDLATWMPGQRRLSEDATRPDFPPPAGERRPDALAPDRRRERAYRLPPLDECRRAFASRLGSPVQWGDE